jgi:hypothetical protein
MPAILLAAFSSDHRGEITLSLERQANRHGIGYWIIIVVETAMGCGVITGKPYPCEWGFFMYPNLRRGWTNPDA